MKFRRSRQTERGCLSIVLPQCEAFERGDAWYRTGDLMRQDANGFFYFIDWIGDTFCWKGENVATSEDAATIAAFSGIKEANGYGIRVPGKRRALQA